ncbi:MAG: hypothetical protein M0Z33_11280 [Actinomycetota bacterium]|nr:hypothetical protein [Actinomycetota bacterium]
MRRNPPKSLAYGLVAVAAGGLAVGLAVGLPGGSAPAPVGYPVVPGAGPVATATASLRAELAAQRLRLVQLACVENGRSYQGHEIVRCSADFGDPHVQAYCTVVIGNRLVTNYENPRIPCRPDWAGWHVIAFSSSPHT